VSLFEKIKIWYRGKYVPPPQNDPNSPIVIISPGHYQQPVIAKTLIVLGQFLMAHWKWIIGIIVAVAGIIVSLFKK
jgi:hypothetical protein